MTREDFDTTIVKFLRQKPFLPFVVELTSGRQIIVDGRKLAVGGGGAAMLTRDEFIEFHCNEVKDIRVFTREAAS